MSHYAHNNEDRTPSYIRMQPWIKRQTRSLMLPSPCCEEDWFTPWASAIVWVSVSRWRKQLRLANSLTYR